MGGGQGLVLGDGSEGPRSLGDVIKMAMREQGSK